MYDTVTINLQYSNDKPGLGIIGGLLKLGSVYRILIKLFNMHETGDLIRINCFLEKFICKYDNGAP